jgi:hypothetical protein
MNLTNIENSDKLEKYDVVIFKISNSLKLTNINNFMFSKKLVKLDINTTRLNSLPNKLLESLTNLESLILYNNYFESFDYSIPAKLTYINLSHNMLTSLNIKDTKKLEKVNLKCNKLTIVPNCMKNKDIIVDYTHNNFNIPNIQLFVNRNVKKLSDPDGIFVNNTTTELYDTMVNDDTTTELYDTTVDDTMVDDLNDAYKTQIKLDNNVHKTVIQDTVYESIKKLRKIKDEINPVECDSIKEIIRYYKNNTCWLVNISNYLFGRRLFKELNYFRNSDYTYCLYETDINSNDTISFTELIDLIWIFIKSMPEIDKPNLMESLRFQILDGIGFCQVGKITRLVNSLISFSDIVVYKESNNDKISKEAIRIKSKNKSCYSEGSKMYITSCIKELKLYLDSLDIPNEEQIYWLDSF